MLPEVASSFVAAGFLIPTVHLLLEQRLDKKIPMEVTHHRLIGYWLWIINNSIFHIVISYIMDYWLIGLQFPTISHIIFLVTWNMKSFVEQRSRRSRRSRLRIVCLLWIIDFSDGSKQSHFHMSCGPYLLHKAIDGVFLPRSPVP